MFPKRHFLLRACLFLLSQLENCSSSRSLVSLWLDTRVNARGLYYMNWKMCLDLAVAFLLLDTHCLHSFPTEDTVCRSQRIRESYVGAYHNNFYIPG